MDIVSILKKQKQDLKDILIKIEAQRDFDKTPAVFTEINLEFQLFGKLDYSKVEKAINLSMDKYCSVSAMLENTVNISYSFNIIEC